MDKITPVHLRRKAVVYVRQSTQDQVRNNKESQRWQYDLKDRPARWCIRKESTLRIPVGP